jgi:DNA-directed RNA polymerase specialized sigma24 family protein
MTEPRTDEADSTDGRTRVATVLVQNHRAFLRFLERRVGDRALAEDLLQDAFTRNLDRLSDVP